MSHAATYDARFWHDLQAGMNAEQARLMRRYHEATARHRAALGALLGTEPRPQPRRGLTRWLHGRCRPRG